MTSEKPPIDIYESVRKAREATKKLADAMRAIRELYTCNDCQGSGQYTGLNHIGECQTCEGEGVVLKCQK